MSFRHSASNGKRAYIVGRYFIGDAMARNAFVSRPG